MKITIENLTELNCSEYLNRNIKLSEETIIGINKLYQQFSEIPEDLKELTVSEFPKYMLDFGFDLITIKPASEQTDLTFLWRLEKISSATFFMYGNHAYDFMDHELYLLSEYFSKYTSSKAYNWTVDLLKSQFTLDVKMAIELDKLGVLEINKFPSIDLSWRYHANSIKWSDKVINQFESMMLTSYLQHKYAKPVKTFKPTKPEVRLSSTKPSLENSTEWDSWFNKFDNLYD